MVAERLKRVSSFAASLCALACAESTLAPVPQEVPVPRPSGICRSGGILGTLCNGTTPLAGATLTLSGVDCAGEPFQASEVAAVNGEFALADIPGGTHALVITSGTFSTTLTVTVTEGQMNRLEALAPNAPFCAQPVPPRMMVVTGEFDNVSAVLRGLGVAFDTVSPPDWPDTASTAEDFLLDLDRMKSYEAILFDCGHTFFPYFAMTSTEYVSNSTTFYRVSYDYTAQIYENLRQYLAAGGNVYTSDFMWPLVEGTRADALNWYGDEGNLDTGLDGIPGWQQVYVGKISDVQGAVRDRGLRNHLGVSTMRVYYDNSEWCVATSAGANVEVLISGDVVINTIPEAGYPPIVLPNQPILVAFQPYAGGGRLLYTTFHFSENIPRHQLEVLRYLLSQL